MRKMYAVDNLADYLAQIDDVIFDLEELVACADEDEGEELAEFAPRSLEIADCLKALRDGIAAGGTELGGGEEMPCMPLAREIRRALPFYPLLEAINRTFRHGLEEQA